MKRLFFLLIIIFIICYLLNNNILSGLYVFKANISLNNKNIENALNSYEKSFNYGNKSSKDRNNYVNIILKSSLNSDSQERLINFLKLKIYDDARKLTENTLNNLRDEIKQNYSDNYIRQASYNQKILRWNEYPITYSIELSENIPNYYIKAINNAFMTWQNATNNKLCFKEVTKNANIKVVFSQTVQNTTENNNKVIIAYTMPTIEANKLKKMQINFKINDFKGDNFSEERIYDTALHEIAHALGIMGHSDSPNDILYLYSNENEIFDKSTFPLTQADINTMILLYDIKPDISNNTKGIHKYHPMIVIGNNNDIVKAKKREAEIYIDAAPKLPSGYIDLAEVNISQKDYQNAVKNLKKALNLTKSKKMQALIYHNLAVASYLDKDYINAQKYIFYALDIETTDEFYYILAKIYLKNNNINGAINLYKDLIIKNPHNIDYVIELTNIYITNYQYISAIKTLKNYIKYNPNEKDNNLLKPYRILKPFYN